MAHPVSVSTFGNTGLKVYLNTLCLEDPSSAEGEPSSRNSLKQMCSEDAKPGVAERHAGWSLAKSATPWLVAFLSQLRKKNLDGER